MALSYQENAPDILAPQGNFTLSLNLFERSIKNEIKELAGTMLS